MRYMLKLSGGQLSSSTHDPSQYFRYPIRMSGTSVPECLEHLFQISWMMNMKHISDSSSFLWLGPWKDTCTQWHRRNTMQQWLRRTALQQLRHLKKLISDVSHWCTFIVQLNTCINGKPWRFIYLNYIILLYVINNEYYACQKQLFSHT
jgi:hypothetical protein